MLRRSLNKFRRALGRLVPHSLSVLIHNSKVLALDFGQVKSARRWACIDRKGDPIPWYTYPAIEYLAQLDFTQKTFFEYGSGYSSIFWARRCRSIVSVENDKKWFAKIAGQLPENARYELIEPKAEYVDAINRDGHQFDVIVIDGSHRYECAVAARPRLADDGVIILDNSDWLPRVTRFLRDSGLIQVDMAGFGPINRYTWTTSLFLSRSVRIEPRLDRLPAPGTGSKILPDTWNG